MPFISSAGKTALFPISTLCSPWRMKPFISQHDVQYEGNWCFHLKKKKKKQWERLKDKEFEMERESERTERGNQKETVSYILITQIKFDPWIKTQPNNDKVWHRGSDSLYEIKLTTAAVVNKERSYKVLKIKSKIYILLFYCERVRDDTVITDLLRTLHGCWWCCF